MIIIQNGIRAAVFKHTNGRYTIPQQDEDTLKIIMRSMFLEHSANLSHNVPKQIEEINNTIIEYAVPQIIGEIEAYVKYKNDISFLPVPLAHPNLASCKDKTLELKNFF